MFYLFKIIFNHEAKLYLPFREGSYYKQSKSIHEKVLKFARAVILNEKLEEDIYTADEVFAEEIVNMMAPEESKNMYRKLGEAIFLELADIVKESLSNGEDIVVGIQRMEEAISDETYMHSIIKKLRSKYDETEIKAVILAFRKAYGYGHFEDLEDEFHD